jgi:predicted glutamine amidotransferase
MCELFGLSSSGPVSPRQLLCRFGAHGGDVADNPDGWGLATVQDGAFNIAKEPLSAAHSGRFRALCERTHSALIIGHVRKSNPPTARVLANTHPFRRICCGREWVFAHNGVIPDAITLPPPSAEKLCVPSGETDSEQAFCVLLDGIAPAFTASQSGSDGVWLEALARVAEMLASHGRFNFLMSDGVNLVAYGHDRLHSLVSPRLPGGDGVPELAVIATEPLIEEMNWSSFQPCELRVYRAGRLVARVNTRPRAATMATGEADGARDIGLRPAGRAS